MILAKQKKSGDKLQLKRELFLSATGEAGKHGGLGILTGRFVCMNHCRTFADDPKLCVVDGTEIWKAVLGLCFFFLASPRNGLQDALGMAIPALYMGGKVHEMHLAGTPSTLSRYTGMRIAYTRQI